MEDILLKEVETVVEEWIRPQIKLHGGNIIVNSVIGKIVRITLTGNCHGCPSAQITTEEVVGEILKEKFGDAIEKVVLVNQVNEELLDFAKKILNGGE